MQNRSRRRKCRLCWSCLQSHCRWSWMHHFHDVVLRFAVCIPNSCANVAIKGVRPEGVCLEREAVGFVAIDWRNCEISSVSSWIFLSEFLLSTWTACPRSTGACGCEFVFGNAGLVCSTERVRSDLVSRRSLTSLRSWRMCSVGEGSCC